MNRGQGICRFLLALCLVAICVTPGIGQGRGDDDNGNGNTNGGGNNTQERDKDRDWQTRSRGNVTTGTTPTPEAIVVVPVPTRRTTTTTRRRTKPAVAPGDRLVAMSDEVQQSDIHMPIGPGPFAMTPDGLPEYIAIGPEAESGAAIAALVDAGATVLRQRDYPNLDRNVLIFDLDTLALLDARQILATVAPGFVLSLNTFYEFSQGRPRLYAAALVNQPANTVCRFGSDIRIGQIDGPVARDHPALQGVALTTHSVLEMSDPPVSEDHGTAVATLMIGQDSDGALTGFAAGAALFAVSAFSREGAGEAASVERIGAALDWLVGNEVQLINMSFAGPVNAAFDTLLSGTAEQGAILIAAAGNDGQETAVYPASADPVIGVTAVDAALRRYRFANTGTHVDFAAPGVDLYVATADGGTYATGTSYAAPIITSLAARLLDEQRSSANSLRTRLRGHSVDLGDSGRDDAFGWGLVKSDGC